MGGVCVNPFTPAERLAQAQACVFQNFSRPYSPFSVGPFGAACAAPRLDVFQTTIDADFGLDGPVLHALLPQLVSLDVESACCLLASQALPPRPLSPAEADQWLNRLLSALKDSTVGLGNVGGNLTSAAEATLRAAWRRQAVAGFESLLTGSATHSIRLSTNITVEARKIGAGGVIRAGAKLVVRVRGLPSQVIHDLHKAESMLVPKSGGTVGVLRVGAQNAQGLERTALAVADARVRAVGALRFTGTKAGGGVLTFGPSAAIDFYHAYKSQSGASNVAKDFALRSAKSQSGNLIGVGAGVVAVAAVGVVGAPAIVVALGVEILAQTAWGYFGGDEWAASKMSGLID